MKRNATDACIAQDAGVGGRGDVRSARRFSRRSRRPSPARAVQPHVTQPGPASVADLAEGLLDAVVNISTSQNDQGHRGAGHGADAAGCRRARRSRTSSTSSSRTASGGGEPAQQVQSLGSGFVIDAAQGIIVTNNHVIDDADEIEVNFSDGSKLKAELVGTDTKTDIAVLKVDPTARR